MEEINHRSSDLAQEDDTSEIRTSTIVDQELVEQQTPNAEIVDLPLQSMAQTIYNSANTQSNEGISSMVITENTQEVFESNSRMIGSLAEQKTEETFGKFNEGEEQKGESTCIICFEPYNSNGPHRLVSIKCGHLFGKSCIESWILNSCQTRLKNKKTLKAKCPQCSKLSGLFDVRILFVRAIEVVDNSEIVNLKQQLDKIKAEKSALLIENKQLLLREEFCNYELKKCKQETIRLRREFESKISELAESRRISAFINKKFKLHQKIVISNKKHTTRVFGCYEETVVVSVKMDESYFGLMKFDLAESKSALKELILLHSKEVKDLKVFADEFVKDSSFTILSGGSDKLFYVLDSQTFSETTYTKNYVFKFEAESAIWSIYHDPTTKLYYLGYGNGKIKEFGLDNDNLVQKERIIAEESLNGPVIWIRVLFLSQEGSSTIIAATFSRIVLIQSNNQKESCMIELKRYETDEMIYSVRYESQTELLLVSLRSNFKTVHKIYRIHLINTKQDSQCNNNDQTQVHVEGPSIKLPKLMDTSAQIELREKKQLEWHSNQPYLSRTCIFFQKCPSNDYSELYVVAGDGSDQHVVLWKMRYNHQTDTMEKFEQTQDPENLAENHIYQIIEQPDKGIIMDIQFHNDRLMVLTDNSLFIYGQNQLPIL